MFLFFCVDFIVRRERADDLTNRTENETELWQTMVAATTGGIAVETTLGDAESNK